MAPSDHRGPLRTNRGRAVPWTDERAARDGRQWSRRDLLEVCRSMSLDKRGVMDPEVQRLVIGQLLVIVVPVGILWFVWIKMLDK